MPGVDLPPTSGVCARAGEMSRGERGLLGSPWGGVETPHNSIALGRQSPIANRQSTSTALDGSVSVSHRGANGVAKPGLGLPVAGRTRVWGAITRPAPCLARSSGGRIWLPPRPKVAPPDRRCGWALPRCPATCQRSRGRVKRPSARRPGRTGGSPWLCGSLLDAAGAGWPPLALPGARSPSSPPPGTRAVSAWRAGRLRRLGPCRAGWGPALSPPDQRASHPGHQRPESATPYSAYRARVRLCAFSAHGRNGPAWLRGGHHRAARWALEPTATARCRPGPRMRRFWLASLWALNCQRQRKP